MSKESEIGSSVGKLLGTSAGAEDGAVLEIVDLVVGAPVGILESFAIEDAVLFIVEGAADGNGVEDSVD